MNAIREAPGIGVPGKPSGNNDLQGYYNQLRFVVANFIYDMLLLVLLFVLMVGAL